MTPALRHFGDHIFSQPFLHLPFFGSSLVTILGSLSLHTNHIIQNNDWIDFQTLCKKSLFFHFFASEIKRGGDFKQHQRFSSNSGETGYSTQYTCHTCHREAWPISTADFVPTELARAVTEIQSIRRSLIFRAPLALALIPDFSERRSRSRLLKIFRAALPLALAKNPSAALPSALKKIEKKLSMF